MNKLSKSRSTYTRKRISRRFKRYKGVVAFTKTPVRRTFEVDLDVNAAYNTTTGIGFYTFDTSTSTPQHYYEFLSSQIFQGTEFKQMINQYGLFRVTGFAFGFARQLNASVNTVYYLPDLSITIGPQENTTYFDKTLAYSEDNALRVQPLNSDSKIISKYFRMACPIITSGGYTLPFGRNVWASTNQFQSGSNFPFYAFVGHIKNPEIATTSAVRVGNMQIKVYIEFADPRQRIPL